MTISVSDPYDAASDPALPTVRLALEPDVVQRRVDHHLSRACTSGGRATLTGIRVTRHKPGKRCVIEYDLSVKHGEGSQAAVVAIGKIRAGRNGKTGFRLLDAFWHGGFAAAAPDGICVPEPLGNFLELQMWLQRKVNGRVLTELLSPGRCEGLMERVALAAHKVHTCGVPAKRSHSIADEMRILQERLPLVGQAQPRLAARIARVLSACDRLAASLPEPAACGIHRDFYPDQVIVDGERLVLIDFDLYCLGDPALDPGNFLAHLTEHALRVLGKPDALADAERTLTERFLALAGPQLRHSVAAYADLSLARHIYLSTLFPERRPFTLPLLELCEQRLDVPCVARATA